MEYYIRYVTITLSNLGLNFGYIEYLKFFFSVSSLFHFVINEMS